MSDQARIAEVLRRHRRVLNLDSGTSHCFAARSGQCDFAGGVRADWEAHVAPLIGAALRPRIETLEQLDALPPETIVKTEGGTVACRFYDREHGVVFCDDRPFKWSALATELPAIVLWSPEVDR